MLTGQLPINQSVNQAIQKAIKNASKQTDIELINQSIDQASSQSIGKYLPYSPNIFTMSMTTDSVQLIDEYLPIQTNKQSDNQSNNQPVYLKRINSAIHIKISLTDDAKNMLKPATQASNRSSSPSDSQSSNQYNNRSNNPSNNQSNRGRGGRSSRGGGDNQPWKKQKR